MGSRLKEAEVDVAKRLLGEYQKRLEGGKDSTHRRELEYIKHLLGTPSFKKQVAMPAHNEDRDDSVFEDYSPAGKKPLQGKGELRPSRNRSSSGRNPSPLTTTDGKDRRFSSGSESGSKEHTWLRLKKKKEKQFISLRSNIVEHEKEEESGVDTASRNVLRVPKSTSTSGISGQTSSSPSDTTRKVKSFSNLQESDDSTEADENKGQTGGEECMSRVMKADVTQSEVVSTSQHNREIVTVSLHKPKHGGLGFSVIGLRSNHKVGTFIQEIQPGGVADSDGRLAPDDEILSINGSSVSGMPQESAIELLRSAKGRVDLVIARVKNKESSQVLLPSKASKEHRRYNIETVELLGKTKSFGLSFTEGRVGGVEINEILDGSIADKDGRLKVGDRLLQINNHNAEHMTCHEAVRQLHGMKGSVRLVIARVASDTQPDLHMKFTLSHTYDEEYEVELKKDSSGLGIEIAGVEHQGMQGIVISSIVRGGPADKTKKMRVGDQVLKVDGKDVRDLESKVAAAAIRNSGEKVKLALGRMQSPRAEWAQISNTSLQQPTQRNTFNIDEFTDQDIERIKSKWKQRLGGGTLMEIKVVTITKASADGGLGVRLDGIQERDDNDVPQGYIHHVIHTVKPDGPVRQQGGLEVGDELLEVNGTSLIDLSHEKAVQVIKNSPSKILIVAAPYQPTSNSPSPNTLREMITKGPISYYSQDDTTSVEGHLTSESEEDSKKKPVVHKLLLDKMNFPDEWKTTVERIRAERESLREKFEAEKERLRIKIERNKKEYEKQLVEQEKMLREHQESVQKWKQEVEQQEEEDRIRREQKRQELMTMEKYNDLPPWPKVLEEARRNTGLVMSPCPSVSSPEAHSTTDLDASLPVSNSEEDDPAEVSGEWSSILVKIELVKGPDGLGFSLMHFKVKDNTNLRVILVHDIVYGGVAHLDERLQIADQLVSINGTDVTSKPLSFTANMLKSIERGPVVLGVRHALHCSLLEEDLQDTIPMGHSASVSSLTRGLMKGVYRPEERVVASASPSARNFHQSPRSAFHIVPIPTSQDPMQSGTANHRHSRSASEPVAMGVTTAPGGLTFKAVNTHNSNVLGQQSTESGDKSSSGFYLSDLVYQTKKMTSHSVSDIFDKFETSETRTCTIALTGKGLGLSLGTDEAREVIVVKNIGRGGAIERDGRIRVGDQIISINGKSLEGTSVQKARSTLKKATLKHIKEVTLCYLPCPQGYVPKVSLVNSETPSASEPETPVHSAFNVGQTIHENTSLSHTLPSGPHSRGPLHSSPLTVTPRTNRISSTSTVIEHTTTDEDTSGSRENITSSTNVTQQLLDLLQGADPSTKNMIMASTEEGPIQRAAKAKGEGKKKFPMLSVASLDGIEGSRDESGGTPDGLSPDFDGVGTELPSITSSDRQMSHQHSRSTDAVKMRSERAKRKPGTTYNRHSCDAIHMIESSSSDSEAELGTFHHRRSGPRKRNNGGGSGGNRHMFQPPQPLQQQHHQRQGSHAHELSNGDGEERPHSHQGSDGKIVRTVQLYRDSMGSLGIGIVGGEKMGDPKVSKLGICVKSISPHIMAQVKGKLKPGDQILKVNGVDLANRTHKEVVKLMKTAPDPVNLVVRARSEGNKSGRKTSLIQSHPHHSQHNSWAIEEDEDPALRSQFPSADGHLYEVEMERGQHGFGMSICDKKNGHVIIASIAGNGVADRVGKIKVGDVIVKVNDSVALSMSSSQVGSLLKVSKIRLVLLRPSAFLMQPNDPFPRQEASRSGLQGIKSIFLQRDDQLGLGFAVEEKKVGNGEVWIIVNDIVPGGPAHKEGSLSKGDHLLSVDGESLVGHGVTLRQATHLLQQARAKGSVSLMIASMMKKDSAASAPGGLSGEMTGKQQSPRLLSSHSEYDTRVVRVKKRHQSPKKRTNGEFETEDGVLLGRHTPHDAKQDIPMKLQLGEPIQNDRECTLELTKLKNSLGVRIVGGSDTLLKDIFIQDILPGTAAHMDGRLRSGDRITRVNNISLVDTTHAQANQSLMEAKESPSPFIHLTVIRDPARAPKISFSDDPISASMNIETIELKKSRTGLGLTIVERESEPGVFVEQVFPNSPAFKSGKVRAGDKIIAINGQNVASERQDVVFLILQGCKEVVRLTVVHPVCTTPTSKGNSPLQPSTSQPLKITPITPSQQLPSSQYQHPYSTSPNQRPILPSYPGTHTHSTPNHPSPHPSSHQQGHPSSHPSGHQQGHPSPHPSTHLSNLQQGHSSGLPSGLPSGHQSAHPPSHQPGHPSPHPSGHSTYSPSSMGRLPSHPPPYPTPSYGYPKRPPMVHQSSFPPLTYNMHQTNTGGSGYVAPQIHSSPTGNNYNSLHIPHPSTGSAYSSPQLPPPYQSAHHYQDPSAPHAQQDFNSQYKGYKNSGEDGSDPPYTTSQQSTGKCVKLVRLHKGHGGLGFTIVGGVGSPLGNLPIMVKDILKDGAAWNDGRLQSGDEILSVNGVSFQGVTQAFALDTLRSIQTDIEMHILSN